VKCSNYERIKTDRWRNII